VQPFFLSGSAGNLFAVYFPPASEENHHGDILFVPPFAEELNRSRHMISRQARTFAQQGYGVLLLDLYGTGDSEGRFHEALWPIWKDDLSRARNWLQEKSGKKTALWAMRTGALLALDLLQDQPEFCEKILFWAPVSNGRNFINQFLRIKLAADMAGNEGDSSTKSLLKQLEGGQSLEIGGYELTPEMARSLSTLSLAKLSPPADLKIFWHEISLTDPAKLSPGSERIITKWKDEGIIISAQALKDVPFWSLQEPEWAHSMIEASAAFTS